ncbi:MAG: hypothetical protein COB41_00335 [Proteobacteria bacterium]|nr:MAG: hypothetical protein COB41_00335 [Pseudomonadota bacterium]
MNKVNIGFSRPKKWKLLAAFIMLVGGTNYSHTFVTWKDPRIKRRKVFEAVGSGIRILSNVTFKRHAEVIKIYSFEVSDEKLIEIEQLAHDMAGTSYGYKALVGIGVIKVFNFFNSLLKLKGRQTNNIFKDGASSNVCIEAGARILFKILDKSLPSNIESFELDDYDDLVSRHGKKMSQAKIDRINKKDNG